MVQSNSTKNLIVVALALSVSNVNGLPLSQTESLDSRGILSSVLKVGGKVLGGVLGGGGKGGGLFGRELAERGAAKPAAAKPAAKAAPPKKAAAPAKKSSGAPPCLTCGTSYAPASDAGKAFLDVATNLLPFRRDESELFERSSPSPGALHTPPGVPKNGPQNTKNRREEDVDVDVEGEMDMEAREFDDLDELE